jgi:hypothetical protein
MTEKDLRRLQETGCIMGYEVLEQDAEGNVLEVRIRRWPEMDRRVLSARLRAGMDEATRKRRLLTNPIGEPRGR